MSASPKSLNSLSYPEHSNRNNVSMDSNAERIRGITLATLQSDQLHEHQRLAARKTFDAFTGSTRAVVLAAEMQAGKSGISLALACEQRLSLSDEDVSDRSKLRDTLYMLTMVDTALLAQAKEDLKDAKNAVVSNFNRFEADIENEFRNNPPKLIIIDECHYGANIRSVRYNRIFDYLEENDNCKIVFISATPFGALYAAEEAYDVEKQAEMIALEENDQEAAADARSKAEELAKRSLIRRSFDTKLVFHRTSDEYFGVREMLNSDNVKSLPNECRSFITDSPERRSFIEHFNKRAGPGWSLIRVPAGTAMETKEFFTVSGIPEHNIYIIGKSLTGVPEDEQTTIDRFKREYDDAKMFNDKFIAITVAGCRAGINFGSMKNHLISTWDSTVASVAAVVQANIGRACGYHDNRDSIHFTNLEAADAYAASLDHLEQTTNEHAASDFEGLRDFFDELCEGYNVKGLDVGLTISRQRRRPIGDVETYLTDSYVAVPMQLSSEKPDYHSYTEDPRILQAIDLIRNEYLRDYGPKRKGHRAMRGKHRNWIKAQWVNGDTYDNKEKAGTLGTLKDKTLLHINNISRNQRQEFNEIVAAGAGERTENKEVVATVFSIYNSSRRDATKKVMNEDDMKEICGLMGLPNDNTIVVLFKRGEYDEAATQRKIVDNERPDSFIIVNEESHFGPGAPDIKASPN